MVGRNRDKRGDSPVMSPETPPFDRWLHKQMHALYGSFAGEPLPDGLIALIDRDSGVDREVGAKDRAAP